MATPENDVLEQVIRLHSDTYVTSTDHAGTERLTVRCVECQNPMPCRTLRLVDPSVFPPEEGDAQ